MPAVPDSTSKALEEVPDWTARLEAVSTALVHRGGERGKMRRAARAGGGGAWCQAMVNAHFMHESCCVAPASSLHHSRRCGWLRLSARR